MHVNAPSQAERSRVNGLGLDTTEHGDARGVEVVLHSAADAQRLRDAGFTWTVRDADLRATMRKAAEADKKYAASVADSGLPSGRTSYRTLDEINAELDALAANPRLVRSLTLPNASVEGRPVRGIEITTDAANIQDGKPVFLMLGAHHAREWPSVEHTMEFAYDLLENYGSDARARKVVQKSRTIIVPVVNVDGFSISRAASPLGDFSLFDYEMKRKNCSISVNTPAPTAAAPAATTRPGGCAARTPTATTPASGAVRARAATGAATPTEAMPRGTPLRATTSASSSPAVRSPT